MAEIGSVACGDCSLRPRLAHLFKGYGRDATIYHQGEDQSGVYYVSSGLIGLGYVDRAGNTVTDRLVRTGSSFGYASFLSESSHSVTAQALIPARVLHVSGAAAAALSRDHCRFRRLLERDLAQAVISRRTDLLVGEKRNLAARILWLLGQLASEAGTENRRTFRLPLNNQKMARLLNARPESLSRCIRRLHDAGICRFKKGTVEMWVDLVDDRLSVGSLLPDCPALTA